MSPNCPDHDRMVREVTQVLTEVHAMKESFSEQKADSKELLTRFEAMEKKMLVWGVYLTIGVGALSWALSHTETIKGLLS